MAYKLCSKWMFAYKAALLGRCHRSRTTRRMRNLFCALNNCWNVPRARGKGEKAKDKCSTGGNNIGNLMLPWKMQRNPGVCALYIFAFLAKQRFYSFPLLGRGNCTGKVKSIYTFSRTKQINKKAKPVKSYPPFFGQECFPLLCMMCVLIGTVGHICWWQ